MIEGQHNIAKRIAYWLVIICITFAISRFFLDRFPWEWPHSDIRLLMDGTAQRPYVYRVLVPLLVKVATDILPLPVTVYVSLLAYFSLLGFVICIRSFSMLFWKSAVVVDSIGVISLIMLLPLMIWNEQVNDFTTLLLFSLGLKFMAQAKWKLFFLVYIIGCLNKETTILLSLVFFVCFWHRTKDIFFWKLLIAQMTIYTGLRFAIMWKFHNNPGGIVENHFWEHVSAIQAAPRLVLTNIFLGMLLILLIVMNRNKKPFFLKRAALGLVPTLFILYLLWGYPLEIRVFYEAYPIIVLLVLPTVCQFLGVPFWPTQYTYAVDSRVVSLYASRKQEFLSYPSVD
jgi:hypothetical protein